jgi:transposase
MEEVLTSSTPTAPALRRGRPEKLTLDKVQALVSLSQESGRTFKALSAERHIPYASLVAALKRHGLSPRAGRKAVAVAVEAPATAPEVA